MTELKKKRNLDHIGIAVRNLEEALTLYQEGLGFSLLSRDEIPTEGVRVAMLDSGESRVELLEPLNPESPIAKFLASGKKGIHHIAFRVENLKTELSALKEKGVRVIEPAPRKGAHGMSVAFIHPASAGGVLLEFVEYPEEN